MKSIRLLQEAGEFCTARTHSSIPALCVSVQDALAKGEQITIDRRGVKCLTVSFLDEWLGPIIIQFGLERVKNDVLFQPVLEPFLARQLERSERLRLSRDPSS